MRKNCRKILFVFVLLCFITKTANIMLVLHLMEHDKDGHHDHRNCPICQQAVVNKVKAVILEAPIFFEQRQIAVADIYIIEHVVKSFKFCTPYLRAPPVAA